MKQPSGKGLPCLLDRELLDAQQMKIARALERSMYPKVALSFFGGSLEKGFLLLRRKLFELCLGFWHPFSGDAREFIAVRHLRSVRPASGKIFREASSELFCSQRGVTARQHRLLERFA